MQHDEVIWTVISQGFCSYKVKHVTSRSAPRARRPFSPPRVSLCTRACVRVCVRACVCVCVCAATLLSLSFTVLAGRPRAPFAATSTM
jgi:hypothetical protein